MRFALVALAALATSPAVARTTPPVEGVVVTFRDLDLKTDAGRARLARRIHAAAAEVCADSADRECSRGAAARAYLNLQLALIDTRPDAGAISR